MTKSIDSAASETQRVFEHHLVAFAKGLDELMKDYNEESEIITPGKTFSGISEIREFFSAFLDSCTPDFWDAFKILDSNISRNVAYLVWEAKPWIGMATDTIVVSAGKIGIQTFTALRTN